MNFHFEDFQSHETRLRYLPFESFSYVVFLLGIFMFCHGFSSNMI